MARNTVALVVVGCVTLVGRLAVAGIFVSPGPGTPVQDAIDAASPGEIIRLALGTYPEHIVVNKPLRLRGVTSIAQNLVDTTLFDGQCAAGPVITVAADDVQIQDLAILGPIEEAIAVQGRTRVKLKRLFIASTCPVVTAPAYDVVQSTRVTMVQTWAIVYASRPEGPAGIRLADAPAGGRNRLRRVASAGYEIGILLENDGARSVRLTGSDANFNGRGIVLEGTSGAVVTHNDLVDNGATGIEAGAGSTGNLIARNRIEGSAADVVDGGTGNCWRDNTFTTGSVPACP